MKTNFTIGLATLCLSSIFTYSAKAELIFYKSPASLDTCVITIQLNTTITCSEGGSITAYIVDGTAPYSYLWNDGSNELSLSNLQSGTYTLVAVDANGCSGNASAEIVVVDSLNTNGAVTMGICGDENGTINTYPLGGTAPYSYNWSTGETTPYLSAPFGLYSLTVTDANGCTASDTFTVVNTASMIPVLNIHGDTCSLSEGWVNILMSGGTAPYTYDWNTGDTVAMLTGLTAGTYSITITDSFECLVTTVFEVPGTPNPFVASNVISTDCGVDSGAVFLVATGGVSPYTYAWNNGETTNGLANLAGGEYIVTVTDSLGCQTIDTSLVEIIGTFPSLNYTSTVATCGFADASIDLEVTEGLAPYTFVWSNSTTAEDLASVPAGLYSVTVTSGEGCPSSESILVVCESQSLSVNGNEQSIGFTVYPNPSKGIINIKPSNVTGNADVIVYDALGSAVYTLTNNKLTKILQLDISKYSAGFYTVVLRTYDFNYIQPLVKE